MKVIVHYQLNAEGSVEHSTLINIRYIKTIQHNPTNEQLIIKIEEEGIIKHFLFDNVKDPLEFLQTNPIEIKSPSYLNLENVFDKF